jgi:hypothetical protein
MARSESASTSGESVEQFAEDLGRLLGTVQAKAEGWVGQRDEIAKRLTEIRDTASQLLQQLGNRGAAAVRRAAAPAAGARQNAQLVATRRPAPAKTSGRKKRVFSAETREKMRLAQLKRWAAHRAG